MRPEVVILALSAVLLLPLDTNGHQVFKRKREDKGTFLTPQQMYKKEKENNRTRALFLVFKTMKRLQRAAEENLQKGNNTQAAAENSILLREMDSLRKILQEDWEEGKNQQVRTRSHTHQKPKKQITMQFRETTAAEKAEEDERKKKPETGAAVVPNQVAPRSGARLANAQKLRRAEKKQQHHERCRCSSSESSSSSDESENSRGSQGSSHSQESEEPSRAKKRTSPESRRNKSRKPKPVKYVQMKSKKSCSSDDDGGSSSSSSFEKKKPRQKTYSYFVDYWIPPMSPLSKLKTSCSNKCSKRKSRNSSENSSSD